MDFSDIIGHKHLVSHLETTIAQGRIPHAQLFIGSTGTGILPMALAYACSILSEGHQKDSSKTQEVRKRVATLSHPDLHFAFPVNKTETVKDKKPVSSMFMDEWRAFVATNPYATSFEWLQQLGIENKQGIMRVEEASEILKKLSLKSFEGGYKVMIIWMPETMHRDGLNKILKLVEEPPAKTVLLFLTENEEQLLTTIQSRCQKLYFPPLAEEDIAQALIHTKGIAENEAKKFAHRADGNFNRALHLVAEDGGDVSFEAWFIEWVRAAFRAKGNIQVLNELLQWSEKMAGIGRETQKKFLGYCVETFRQALLLQYGAPQLTYFEAKDSKFSLEKFAPFVHHNNIFEIVKALEDTSYHIERNGNAKILFTDLSISLTRLIHAKQ